MHMVVLCIVFLYLCSVYMRLINQSWSSFLHWHLGNKAWMRMCMILRAHCVLSKFWHVNKRHLSMEDPTVGLNEKRPPIMIIRSFVIDENIENNQQKNCGTFLHNNKIYMF